MRRERRWRVLLWPGAVLAVLLLFFTALERLDAGCRAEDARLLENSIRRAAVACYAAEGVYPADLAYLETHYGIQVDETRYAVRYEVFAANLMPDITVLETGT